MPKPTSEKTSSYATAFSAAQLETVAAAKATPATTVPKKADVPKKRRNKANRRIDKNGNKYQLDKGQITALGLLFYVYGKQFKEVAQSLNLDPTVLERAANGQIVLASLEDTTTRALARFFGTSTAAIRGTVSTDIVQYILSSFSENPAALPAPIVTQGVK